MTMNFLQRATESLVATESAMKRLIAEAAECGDYPSVEKLVKIASNLSSIRSEEAIPTDRINVDVPNPEESPVTVAAQPSKAAMPLRKAKRRTYPVFAKSGEHLVKIGWSKSSKSEYQHKSPSAVATFLATSLLRLGKSGFIVAMDRILPLKGLNGTEIPDYQTYVSLAWLRSIGAVKQIGRQGYAIKKPKELLQRIEAAWSALPEVTPF